MSISTNHDACVRAYTTAVIRLLLGSRSMKPGIVVTAGEPLDMGGRIALANDAAQTHTDVVHLSFYQEPSGTTVFSDIMLIVPRDRCHVLTGCRLWLAPTGNRGVILPRSSLKGQFRLSPGELIHLPSKPTGDHAAGRLRALAWVDRQARANPMPPEGTELHDLKQAA